jgi:hypothetical protein
MKTFQHSRFGVIILVVLLAISLSNCAVRVATKSSGTSAKTKSLPPGQAKKITGEKSAKRYAPGHNK